MFHTSGWRHLFIVIPSVFVLLSILVSFGVIFHPSIVYATAKSDIRLQWATDWAKRQVGDTTTWGSGKNTYCEQFVENAYGVTGVATNPIDLYNRFGGVPASPALPGEILIFAANNDPIVGNGGNGHAGIYMGGDQMISVQYNGVQWHSVSDWSAHYAKLMGFVYPPSSWPGILNSNQAFGTGGYCGG